MAQADFQVTALTIGRFAVDQQGKTVREGQPVGLGLLHLLLERFGHSVKPQLVELLQRGVVQHRAYPFVVSVVVTRPPDVVVNDRRHDVRAFSDVQFVRARLENVRHALVGVDPVLRRPLARGFQAIIVVLFGQPHDSQRRAEPLLGMGAMLHDRGDVPCRPGPTVAAQRRMRSGVHSAYRR